MTACLPTKWLTECITGSTIKAAEAETARTNAVFFKGVALLAKIMKRSHLGRDPSFKTFCLRNTRPHDNADATPAEP